MEPSLKDGIWVAHSLKFPQRMLEIRLSPKLEAAGVRRASLSDQRLFRYRRTSPGLYRTVGFQLASNEGTSTIYDASYELREGQFHRLPKTNVKKDHYVGLVLDYEPGRLTVAKSEERMIKVYSGNYFEPLLEDALFSAIREGNVAALQLDGVAVDDVYNPLGRTPLYQAASLGNLEMVKALLAAGASPDTCNVNERMRTPIYAAILKSELEILKLLLAAGANPNVQDSQGRTPLHVAADSCGEYRQLVRVLLAADVDLSLASTRGETAQGELERRSKNFLKLFKQELKESKLKSAK
ncbi:ankyrin repeat domain-containing protein [Coraliomargarita algicola]|uniref:Ankyrin repeat domain-containing protein n=1 Tax=Coraliomargarita algicola TaxID=3092156 RepID=A0ABZ0RMH6_9BACT|nr:ankyrin repeat domain-containing protein [Coraliomargarita sp. J2-16]WPJ97425.1 ankyrin repeat domain-containing protein [Coraliomargarita sp. J2-16]